MIGKIHFLSGLQMGLVLFQCFVTHFSSITFRLVCCEDGVSLSSSSSAQGEEDEGFGAWLLSTRRIDIILVSPEPGFPRFWDSVGVLLLATRFGGRLVALSACCVCFPHCCLVAATSPARLCVPGLVE